MSNLETSILDDFSRKSGIKGLNFARSSYTRFERYLWYVAVIVCMGCTIADVSSTIGIYLNHPTATRVRSIYNKTLDFGSPTLCVEMDVFRMVSSKSFGKPQDSLNLLDSIGNLTNFLLTVASSMSENLTDAQNNTRMNSTIDLIVDVLTVLITNVVRAQHHVHLTSVSYNYSWGYVFEEISIDENGAEASSLIPQGSEITAQVALYLSQKNYIFSELAPIVGEILCHKMLFSGKSTRIYSGGRQLKQFCSADKITWLGSAPFNPDPFELICLSLDSGLFKYTTIEDHTTIMLNRDRLYEKSEEVMDDWVYVDFTGGPVYFPRSQNVLSLRSNSQIIVTLMIQGEYRKVKTPKSDCSFVPYESCKFSCRNQYIARMCKCMPLYSYLSNVNHSLKLCGSYNKETNKILSHIIPGLDRCPSMKETQFPYEPNCTEKCSKELCGSYVLAFHMTPQALIDETKMPTYVKMYVGIFQFPLMEEFSLYGVKELIALVGGNLSFYLGINFLVLIHTLLYWIQVPIRYLNEQKRPIP